VVVATPSHVSRSHHPACHTSVAARGYALCSSPVPPLLAYANLLCIMSVSNGPHVRVFIACWHLERVLRPDPNFLWSRARLGGGPICLHMHMNTNNKITKEVQPTVLKIATVFSSSICPVKASSIASRIEVEE
jgi:hypothetical protein